MNIKSEKNFDLGKTLVNKAAEGAIASQITSAESIKVDVDSQASGLVQRQVESVEIACEKIVAFGDISLEQLNISTDNLSLDLTQAILGKVSFEQPGNFLVQVTKPFGLKSRIQESKVKSNLRPKLDMQPCLSRQ